MEPLGAATARRFTRATLGLLGLYALMLTATGTSRAQGVVLTTPINTFAGNGTAGATGDAGLATAAELSAPEGLAFDTKGNVYIADYGNNLIRVVNAAGVISTFAGTTTACANPTAASGACGDGGPVSAATFNNPAQMQFDSAGNLYIADYTDNRIRKVTATNGVITGASIITTVAGNGVGASAPTTITGNGGAATAAAVPLPHGIAVDASGNIYISDQLACVIRKVTASTGNIANFAGNGTCGYAGDSGQANAAGAEINGAVDISLDSAGNLYIADRLNNVVRKVTASTNVISTYAGVHGTTCNPTTATCGDNGAATSAALSGPAAVAFDASGNLVIADADGARIRKVTVSTGNITTIAGTGAACNTNGTASGSCGDGGSALQAKFSFPIGVALNSNNGFVYFTDQYANRVRYLAPAPSFPATNVGATSPALNTIFTTTGTSNTIINSISVPNSPSGTPQFTVGTLSGCVLGGTGNPPGTVCTIPVTFTPSYPGVQSEPLIIVTNGNTLQVGLTGTGVAPQAILVPGVLSTVAGTGAAGSSGNGGAATAAKLNTPREISFDYAGNYYIGDLNNNAIRQVNIATGNISTVAGGGGTNYYTTPGGPATRAALNQAEQVAFDSAGNMYIPDYGDSVVAKVDAVTKNITVIAGIYGTQGNTGDGGPATLATLTGPSALAINQTTGNIYVVDGNQGGNKIRLINTSSGIISTYAGTGALCAAPTANCGDGGPATAAQFYRPQSIALDSNGNLFVSDTLDNRVRRIDATTGIITTVAGTGALCSVATAPCGDGGAANLATLNTPFQIQVDAAGDVFIADSGDNVIRMVSGSTGNISTVAGSQTACTTIPSPACGDGGPANVSAFSNPTGVALDANGNIYVVENGTNRVRKVKFNPAQLTYPTEPVGTSAGTNNETLLNIGNATLTYTTPLSPNSDALVTTTGPTAATSNAFTQTNSTTCGPIYSTTTTGTTLASGANCLFVVNFTPDTAAGNYTGTLVETDNSLYNTASTQTVTLAGAGTILTPTVTLGSNNNPSYLGQSVTFTATVMSSNSSAPAPTGTVTFTYTTTAAPTTPVTITGSPVTVTTTAGVTTAVLSTSSLPLGTDSVTAAYSGDGAYTTASSSAFAQVVQQVSGAVDTVSAASSTITVGDADQLTFAIPVVSGAAVPTGTVMFTSGATALGSGTWPPTPVPTTCPSGIGSCYVLSPPTAPTNIPSGNPTTVTATYTAGAASGYAAPATAPTTSVTVLLADTITVTSPTSPDNVSYTNGGTVPILATATNTTTPLSYSTTSPACTVNATTGVISEVSTGTCVVTVSQAAGGNYAAPTSQTVTVIIGAGVNIITFPTLPSTPAGSPAPSPAATSTAGGTITYASTTPSICTVSGGVITDVAPGTCTITADQGATGNYAAAGEQMQSYQVTPLADTITIPGTVPTTATVGGTVPIGATTTSGVTPTYTSTTPTFCSVSANGVVTPLAIGPCSVTVSQAAAGNYAAAMSQTVAITVNGQSQTIQNFGTPITATFGGTAPVLAATATSGLTPTYSATGTACSVTTSGTVTILAAGTCQITASQVGNSTYAAATPVSETLTVSPEADVITIPPTVPSTATVGGTVSIGATTTSGVTPTYTSTTPTVCSVSTTGVVTTLASGPCSVSVTQPAAGNFAAATPQTVAITVNGQSQTIQNFGTPITATYGGTAPVLAATATSGLTPTYSATGTACSVTTSGTVTILAAGTCQITASQVGNSTYAAATPVSETLTVNPEADVITIPGTVPTTATVGGTVPIGATTTSGVTPTYTSTTPTVCSVSTTGVVTTLASGPCSVSVTQPAAGNFAAATPQTVAITVNGQSQTIQNFGTPITATYGGTAPVLAATATSGLTPTYSATGTACSVTSAGAVTILAAGSCQITASQAGNSTYAAATSVSETLTVSPEADVITIPPTVPSTATVGGTVSIGATTTSGVTPTYTSTTPTVCSVSTTGVVTTLTSGPCSVSVTQPAAGNFAAATPQTVAITVSGQSQTIQNFGTPITATFGGTAPVLAATATSGLTPTYSATGAACSVTTAGTVTILAAGTCQITASQAGNSTYAAATPVSETLTVNPEADVITIPPTVPSTATVGGTVPIGAATTSGVTPTYTSTTPTVCSVSTTGVVTTLTSGPCSVSVTQPAAGNFAAATPQTVNIAVSGQSQTIQNFGSPVTATYGGTAPVLAATATSGLTPTYTATGTACSVTTSGTVTILAAGSCQITASQAGNSTYAAATPVTETLTVNPAADVITIPGTVSTTATVGGTVPIGATTTSGVTPTYTSTTPAVCSVSATGVVTTLTSGSCSVTVSQAAAGNYAAATPQTVAITVSGQSQTIQNFGTPITATYGGTAPVLAATATSGLTPTYSATGAACSVTTSGTVTILAAGSCQITASQAGNSTYAAATPVSETLTVSPEADVITIPPTVPSTATVGGTVPIAATTTSGVTPTYTSTTPTVCSVSATGVVTALGSGTCSVSVTQPAAGNFAAATPQTVTIAIGGQSQTIQNFGTNITTTYGSPAPILVATATSGLAPTYASTGSACSVTNAGAVIILAVGTCQITASQAGNSTYAAATPISETLTVNPAADVITIPPTVPTTATVGSTTPIGATTTSGLPPTYTSTTPAVCSVSSTGVITTLTSGTCSVSVTQPAAGNFAAATPQTVTLMVNAQAQTIQNFGTPITATYGGTAPVLAATATSGLAPTYAATGSACSVTSAGAVTILAVGTCQITASQAGNATYAAATPVSETLTVNPAADVITIPPTVPTTTTVGSNTPIGATTTSGVTPVYTSTTPAVCSVSATGVVTDLTTGSCSVTVSQAAAGNYAAATPQTVTFAVTGQSQTIQNFGAPITATYGSPAPILGATATSGLAPTYSATGAACSVTGAGAVTILAVGTCQITASQSGNATYAAATPVTETLTVNAAADVITIPPTVPATTTVGTNVSIGATTTSGVPPTYTSTTPAVCSVSSTGVVTTLTSGTCAITVTQPAAGNYAAATPQTVNISVSGGTNTITFPALPNTPFTSAPPVPLATATSGQPVTYSTSTAACSVTASGVVTFNSIGTCSVTANQAATGNYAAATPVTQSFLITPGVDAILVPPTVPASGAPGATISIGATSTSGGPITYVSATPAVCTVTSPGGIVTVLTAGACTITLSQPAAGNFAAAPNQTVTFNLYDFSITANTPTSQTVVPGSVVVYTYALAPLGGQYPGANVTYTVTGLPPGATYTLTPTSGSVTQTAGPKTLTLTITTAQALAMNRLRQTAPWSLALLLPLFLRRKLRRRLAQSLVLLFLLSAAAFTVTGCADPNGFFGQPVANYSITVTATSGGVTHSAAPVNLQVQ